VSLGEAGVKRITKRRLGPEVRGGRPDISTREAPRKVGWLPLALRRIN